MSEKCSFIIVGRFIRSRNECTTKVRSTEKTEATRLKTKSHSHVCFVVLCDEMLLHRAPVECRRARASLPTQYLWPEIPVSFSQSLTQRNMRDCALRTPKNIRFISHSYFNELIDWLFSCFQNYSHAFRCRVAAAAEKRAHNFCVCIFMCSKKIKFTFTNCIPQLFLFYYSFYVAIVGLFSHVAVSFSLIAFFTAPSQTKRAHTRNFSTTLIAVGVGWM